MRHRRKLLAAVTCGAVAALALTACSGSGAAASAASSGGKVTLTMSAWDYTKTPEFKAMIDAYEKANPNVTIKPVDIAAADYDTKVTVMLAGGDNTDIITIKDYTAYQQWVDRNQLADLSSLAKGIDKTNYGTTFTPFEVNKKYYAVPYGTAFWFLYYNKDLFDKAGLPYPTTMTWDTFAADAAKLTSGSGDSKVYGTYLHTWPSVIQQIAAAQTGKSLYSSNYDYMKPMYQMALDLQAKGDTVDYGTATTSSMQYLPQFENGKAAMMPMGSWSVAGLIKDKAAGTTSVNWGIAPLPQISLNGKITTMGSSSALAVNKNSKNAAAAEKFIKFATGEEGAQAVAATGTLPADRSKAVLDTYFGTSGMPTDKVSESAFSPDVINPDVPPSPIAAQATQIQTEEHSLIMTKSTSLADGLKEMGQRVGALLKSGASSSS